MATYILTAKGHELLEKGTSRLAGLLELARSVAEDDTVSKNELVSKADMSHEEAEATLDMLQRLELIQYARFG